MKKHYTLLTTFSGQRSSANVGDQLIEVSLKRLIERELGPVEFLTFFREDPLKEHLDRIHATRAVLLPGFAIRDTPLYPNCYRLLENLEDLRVPLIAIGANWNVYPGDAFSREQITYSAETQRFLKSLARQHPQIACREHTLRRVLDRHGITNTTMTGDPAWYDPDYFGKPMKRPTEVRGLLFSPPMSPYFVEQAGDVLGMLAELFPAARRVCAMHCADARVTPFADQRVTNDASMSEPVAEKNARIRDLARKAGFEVREVAGDVRKLEFYKELDLHVGYECHAHIGFFRWRIPSVLIAEDARGVGFNETFGAGGFTGFRRCQGDLARSCPAGGTSGYCVSLEEYSIAPADQTVPRRIERFLREELDSGFCRYLGVGPLIDDTYEASMAPFLRSLP